MGKLAMIGDALSNGLQLWQEFRQWNPPPEVLFATLVYSIGSTYFLSLRVAAPRLIAGPACFAALFTAGLMVNFLCRGSVVGIVSPFNRALLWSTAGQAICAVLLLAIFKVKEAKA